MKKLSTMRVLVTGGAGFIGSHVADGLARAGANVAILDDLSTGSRENVAPSTALYVVDVRNREALRAAFERFKPTHVVHHAAQASVRASMEDPGRDAAINLVGGLEVLEAARLCAVRRIVFASTGGALYGEVATGQSATESWPARPKSPYAAAKVAFEGYLEVFRSSYGLSYTTLRYSNVYGPRQDPNGEAGVVAIFGRRLLRDQPVTVYARRERGDPGCVRDYVFVEDVVAANAKVLAEDLDGVFNVGTGEARTTREVLEAVAAATGRVPRVEEAPPRPGDLESSVVDSSRLVGLGWRPGVAFTDGIRRTVSWLRTQSSRQPPSGR